MALTRSEALVEELCQKSFLSLWSYANPRAKTGKELCDLLVVCDPDVIVFSVKEIGLSDAGDSIAAARWRKRAIDESVKQIYGAVRRLDETPRVVRSDGTDGLPLPSLSGRRVHRVAVALGSSGDVPFDQGDFGKGFVHVLDDVPLRIILSELDTITDFVGYLRAKEALIAQGTTPILTSGEQDLLAVYLNQGRKVSTKADFLLIEPDSWTTMLAKEEWGRRKSADGISYLWDSLIERVASDVTGPGLEFGNADDAERSLRAMAREDRFSRRVLAEAFHEFMGLASQKQVRARTVTSPSGVCYVFLASGHDEDRADRGNELKLRCVAARSLLPSYAVIVGIGTEQYVRGAGHSLDLCFIDIQNWTSEHQRVADSIRSELGYFDKPRKTRASHDEFPQPGSLP